MQSAVLYPSSNARVRRLGTSDPVADVVGLLRPRMTVDPPSVVHGSRVLNAPPGRNVWIGIVTGGHGWLSLPGRRRIALGPGHVYAVTDARRFVVSAAAGRAAAGEVGEHSGAADGAGMSLCGGRIDVDDGADSVGDFLPPVVHVRASDPEGPLLAQLGGLIVRELETAAVGQSLVIDRVCQILLVQLLRAQAARAELPVGWLAALSGGGVGTALRAMHADVGHHWTLPELARTAQMSRSDFAAKFTAQVGTPPLTYLGQWRMSLARDALRRGTHSISELARATGYGSQSAFSTAFRRAVGVSPRQFRHRLRE